MNNLRGILSKIGTEKICPVALIFKENKILIGLRHYTPDKWKKISVWTLPGGRCDQGEPVEATLRREVAEEVGIKDLEIIEFLGEFPGAKMGDLVWAFKTQTKQEPQLLEPQKFGEWKWVLISEIPANFINKSLLGFMQSLR
jgi:8-oxo-dGTP pyrophosphatase MutT (NUDIX family)